MAIPTRRIPQRERFLPGTSTAASRAWTRRLVICKSKIRVDEMIDMITYTSSLRFIDWRVALMEGAVQALGIDEATQPITADNDPYKILQVHDYKSISFLRQSPVVKTASTETIKVFAQNYPELLKEKFFVNVPAFMGFVYTFMKLFVAAKTIKKFHPMSNGANLAKEMASSSNVKGLGDLLPTEYGGKGEDLSATGKQPPLTEETKAEAEAA